MTLKLAKVDGMQKLSSGYMLHSSHVLTMHTALVLSSMIVHGLVPDIFLMSTYSKEHKLYCN